jgi:hypothetical protein
MKAEAISLELFDDGEQGQYAFTCPDCSADVTRPADRKVVALLQAVGVNTREAPAEPAVEAPSLAPEDQGPAPDAPAFTLDDLIDLHFLLEDDAWLSEEIAAGASQSSSR